MSLSLSFVQLQILEKCPLLSLSDWGILLKFGGVRLVVTDVSILITPGERVWELGCGSGGGSLVNYIKLCLNVCLMCLCVGLFRFSFPRGVCYVFTLASGCSLYD